MKKQKTGGGGNRKKGRNKPWCEAYRLRQQREINKASRLAKRIAMHPDDYVAARAYQALPAEAKSRHPLKERAA